MKYKLGNLSTTVPKIEFFLIIIRDDSLTVLTIKKTAHSPQVVGTLQLSRVCIVLLAP